MLKRENIDTSDEVLWCRSSFPLITNEFQSTTTSVTQQEPLQKHLKVLAKVITDAT